MTKRTAKPKPTSLPAPLLDDQEGLPPADFLASVRHAKPDFRARAGRSGRGKPLARRGQGTPSW